jgi:hypothetical protein
MPPRAARPELGNERHQMTHPVFTDHADYTEKVEKVGK